MKKLIFTVCVFAWALSPSVLAQKWTDEQQEVINQAKKNTELWFQAVFDEKDYSKWTEVYAVEDYTFWFIGRGLPMDKAGDVERVKYLQKQFKRIYLEELYPLAVKIYGDIAFLYCYEYNVLEYPDGKTERKEEKRLHVYKKEGDTWKMIEGVAALSDV